MRKGNPRLKTTLPYHRKAKAHAILRIIANNRDVRYYSLPQFYRSHLFGYIVFTFIHWMEDTNKVDIPGENPKLPTGNNELALDLKETPAPVPVPQAEAKEMTVEVSADDFSGTLNNTQVRFVLLCLRTVRCEPREVGHGHGLSGYSPLHIERMCALLTSRQDGDPRSKHFVFLHGVGQSSECEVPHRSHRCHQKEGHEGGQTGAEHHQRLREDHVPGCASASSSRTSCTEGTATTCISASTTLRCGASCSEQW